MVMVPKSRHQENDILTAQKKESKNWNDFEVYSKVSDQGQKTIFTTWVITEELLNNERIVKSGLSSTRI